MGARAKTSKFNLKELIQTPKGKGIAGGLVLVVVILVILLAMTFAFPRYNSQSVQPANNLVAKRIPSNKAANTQVSQQTTPVATTTDTVSVKSDLSNYRDPFKPLAVTTNTASNPVTGGTSDSSQSASSGSSVDVLSLESVTTVNGQKTAVVLYKGQQYTVKAGDKIGSSPFQVTDIGDSNISLLYGDSRLTLQVGDTIVK